MVVRGGGRGFTVGDGNWCLLSSVCVLVATLSIFLYLNFGLNLYTLKELRHGLCILKNQAEMFPSWSFVIRVNLGHL